MESFKARWADLSKTAKVIVVFVVAFLVLGALSYAV